MNSVLQNLCYLAKFNVARRYLCESQGMAGYSSGCNLPKANKKSGSSFGGLVFYSYLRSMICEIITNYGTGFIHFDDNSSCSQHCV